MSDHGEHGEHLFQQDIEEERDTNTCCCAITSFSPESIDSVKGNKRSCLQFYIINELFVNYENKATTPAFTVTATDAEQQPAPAYRLPSSYTQVDDRA